MRCIVKCTTITVRQITTLLVVHLCSSLSYFINDVTAFHSWQITIGCYATTNKPSCGQAVGMCTRVYITCIRTYHTHTHKYTSVLISCAYDVHVILYIVQVFVGHPVISILNFSYEWNHHVQCMNSRTIGIIPPCYVPLSNCAAGLSALIKLILADLRWQ